MIPSIVSRRTISFPIHFPVAALLFFCSVAGSLASPRPLGFADNGQSTISVRSELVVLPVRVTDSHGDFVPGLSQQSFRVFDDGRPQTITLFQQRDTPVTVGLVVDHSRSMGSNLLQVAAAVSAFAQSSNPQDQMFVVDFNDSVSLEAFGGMPFTSDPKKLAGAVSLVSASGKTALYDALIEALNHVRLGQWDKKALVIVSDGGDNVSRHTYSQVAALAQRSQTQIYAIGLLGALDADENPDVLKHLCKNTGGIVYFPDSLVDVIGISTRIARDLREQYTLGFSPEPTASDHSFRKIQVKASAPGRGKLHVMTRPGYFTAGGELPAASSGRGER